MLVQKTKPAFRFKQFGIVQDHAGMKLNTDGVLLGAWARMESNESILDIGTGTGIIALMLAQRSDSSTNIDAVELDPSACIDANLNFENSPFAKQLRLFNQPIQDFCNFSTTKYHNIVSNPPFFSFSTSPSTDQRAMGRHTISLTHYDLLYCVNKLIHAEGRFSVILPLTEGNKMIKTASLHNLYASRITEVISVYGRQIERLLIEFTKKNQDPKVDQMIIKNLDGAYSETYKNLTSAFYLKF